MHRRAQWLVDAVADCPSSPHMTPPTPHVPPENPAAKIGPGRPLSIDPSGVDGPPAGLTGDATIDTGIDTTGVPRPGDILAGKYRVERVLGVGGMGVVVAATHLELDERVAVKFLMQNPTPTADAVARFIREARAAIKIRSEHVVRIFDVGRLENGAPFIVMEYLKGSDLSQVIERDGPLPVHEAVDFVLQACEALASAHGMGIVHRDLKPANLFLTSHADGSPCVKVLDFGISKFMEGDGKAGSGVTTTATIMGTPCFMSPEQLRSTRDVDARADIWALGTILYALLTGAPPYYAETTADVAAKIIRDAPPSMRKIRGDVPSGLEGVIARCLEKDRDQRYPDVASLAAALAGFGSEVAPSTVTRIQRLVSSNPALVAMAPTLRSNPPVRISSGVPSAQGAPTRTASAWGDTKPEKKAPTRKTWWLAGAAVVSASSLVAAALAFGFARHPEPQASTLVDPGTHAQAVAQRESDPQSAPPPPAEDVPRAATANAAKAAPPSTGAATDRAPKGAPRGAQSVATPPSVKAAPPSTSVATEPGPRPASADRKQGAGGLFDDPQ